MHYSSIVIWFLLLVSFSIEVTATLPEFSETDGSRAAKSFFHRGKMPSAEVFEPPALMPDRFTRPELSVTGSDNGLLQDGETYPQFGSVVHSATPDPDHPDYPLFLIWKYSQRLKNKEGLWSTFLKLSAEYKENLQTQRALFSDAYLELISQGAFYVLAAGGGEDKEKYLQSHRIVPGWVFRRLAALRYEHAARDYEAQGGSETVRTLSEELHFQSAPQWFYGAVKEFVRTISAIFEQLQKSEHVHSEPSDPEQIPGNNHAPGKKEGKKTAAGEPEPEPEPEPSAQASVKEFCFNCPPFFSPPMAVRSEEKRVYRPNRQLEDELKKAGLHILPGFDGTGRFFEAINAQLPDYNYGYSPSYFRKNAKDWLYLTQLKKDTLNRYLGKSFKFFPPDTTWDTVRQYLELNDEDHQESVGQRGLPLLILLARIYRFYAVVITENKFDDNAAALPEKLLISPQANVYQLNDENLQELINNINRDYRTLDLTDIKYPMITKGGEPESGQSAVAPVIFMLSGKNPGDQRWNALRLSRESLHIGDTYRHYYDVKGYIKSSDKGLTYNPSRIYPGFAPQKTKVSSAATLPQTQASNKKTTRSVAFNPDISSVSHSGWNNLFQEDRKILKNMDSWFLKLIKEDMPSRGQTGVQQAEQYLPSNLVEQWQEAGKLVAKGLQVIGFESNCKGTGDDEVSMVIDADRHGSYSKARPYFLEAATKHNFPYAWTLLALTDQYGTERYMNDQARFIAYVYAALGGNNQAADYIADLLIDQEHLDIPQVLLPATLIHLSDQLPFGGNIIISVADSSDKTSGQAGFWRRFLRNKHKVDLASLQPLPLAVTLIEYASQHWETKDFQQTFLELSATRPTRAESLIQEQYLQLRDLMTAIAVQPKRALPSSITTETAPFLLFSDACLSSSVQNIETCIKSLPTDIENNGEIISILLLIRRLISPSVEISLWDEKIAVLYQSISEQDKRRLDYFQRSLLSAYKALNIRPTPGATIESSSYKPLAATPPQTQTKNKTIKSVTFNPDKSIITHAGWDAMPQAEREELKNMDFWFFKRLEGEISSQEKTGTQKKEQYHPSLVEQWLAAGELLLTGLQIIGFETAWSDTIEEGSISIDADNGDSYSEAYPYFLEAATKYNFPYAWVLLALTDQYGTERHMTDQNRFIAYVYAALGGNRQAADYISDLLINQMHLDIPQVLLSTTLIRLSEQLPFGGSITISVEGNAESTDKISGQAGFWREFLRNKHKADPTLLQQFSHAITLTEYADRDSGAKDFQKKFLMMSATLPTGTQSLVREQYFQLRDLITEMAVQPQERSPFSMTAETAPFLLFSDACLSSSAKSIDICTKSMPANIENKNEIINLLLLVRWLISPPEKRAEWNKKMVTLNKSASKQGKRRQDYFQHWFMPAYKSLNLKPAPRTVIDRSAHRNKPDEKPEPVVFDQAGSYHWLINLDDKIMEGIQQQCTAEDWSKPDSDCCKGQQKEFCELMKALVLLGTSSAGGETLILFRSGITEQPNRDEAKKILKELADQWVPYSGVILALVNTHEITAAADTDPTEDQKKTIIEKTFYLLFDQVLAGVKDAFFKLVPYFFRENHPWKLDSPVAIKLLTQIMALNIQQHSLQLGMARKNSHEDIFYPLPLDKKNKVVEHYIITISDYQNWHAQNTLAKKFLKEIEDEKERNSLFIEFVYRERFEGAPKIRSSWDYNDRVTYLLSSPVSRCPEKLDLLDQLKLLPSSPEKKHEKIEAYLKLITYILTTGDEGELPDFSKDQASVIMLPLIEPFAYATNLRFTEETGGLTPFAILQKLLTENYPEEQELIQHSLMRMYLSNFFADFLMKLNREGNDCKKKAYAQLSDFKTYAPQEFMTWINDTARLLISRACSINQSMPTDRRDKALTRSEAKLNDLPMNLQQTLLAGLGALQLEVPSISLLMDHSRHTRGQVWRKWSENPDQYFLSQLQNNRSKLQIFRSLANRKKKDKEFMEAGLYYSLAALTDFGAYGESKTRRIMLPALLPVNTKELLNDLENARKMGFPYAGYISAVLHLYHPELNPEALSKSKQHDKTHLFEKVIPWLFSSALAGVRQAQLLLVTIFTHHEFNPLHESQFALPAFILQLASLQSQSYLLAINPPDKYAKKHPIEFWAMTGRKAPEGLHLSQLVRENLPRDNRGWSLSGLSEKMLNTLLPGNTKRSLPKPEVEKIQGFASLLSDAGKESEDRPSKHKAGDELPASSGKNKPDSSASVSEPVACQSLGDSPDSTITVTEQDDSESEVLEWSSFFSYCMQARNKGLPISSIVFLNSNVLSPMSLQNIQDFYTKPLSPDIRTHYAWMLLFRFLTAPQNQQGRLFHSFMDVVSYDPDFMSVLESQNHFPGLLSKAFLEEWRVYHEQLKDSRTGEQEQADLDGLSRQLSTDQDLDQRFISDIQISAPATWFEQQAQDQLSQYVTDDTKDDAQRDKTGYLLTLTAMKLLGAEIAEGEDKLIRLKGIYSESAKRAEVYLNMAVEHFSYPYASLLNAYVGIARLCLREQYHLFKTSAGISGENIYLSEQLSIDALLFQSALQGVTQGLTSSIQAFRLSFPMRSAGQIISARLIQYHDQLKTRYSLFFDTEFSRMIDSNNQVIYGFNLAEDLKLFQRLFDPKQSESGRKKIIESIDESQKVEKKWLSMIMELLYGDSGTYGKEETLSPLELNTLPLLNPVKYESQLIETLKMKDIAKEFYLLSLLIEEANRPDYSGRITHTLKQLGLAAMGDFYLTCIAPFAWQPILLDKIFALPDVTMSHFWRLVSMLFELLTMYNNKTATELEKTQKSGEFLALLKSVPLTSDEVDRLKSMYRQMAAIQHSVPDELELHFMVPRSD